LTLDQLAKRWGISRDHVRQLVDAGHLPGAFTIPSVGCYGAALKIPLSSVLRAETEAWLLTPKAKGRGRPAPPKGRSIAGSCLKALAEFGARAQSLGGAMG
jgi:hypothetical protein